MSPATGSTNCLACGINMPTASGSLKYCSSCLNILFNNTGIKGYTGPISPVSQPSGAILSSFTQEYPDEKQTTAREKLKKFLEKIL